MSVEIRGGGAEYVAAELEFSQLHLLAPDLLAGIGTEVTDIAQEECTIRYGVDCQLAESVQLAPRRIVLSYLCQRHATCQRLCEQAAEHAGETAQRYAQVRLGQVAVQN